MGMGVVVSLNFYAYLAIGVWPDHRYLGRGQECP
jgi:hypothetical protein